MNKTMASMLIASLLVSFSVHALEARSEDEIRENLAKIQVESDETALNRDKDLILSNLNSVARSSNAEAAVGLSRTLTSSVGSVNVLAVADLIIKAHRDLADSTKISNKLDASAAKMKSNLDAGLEVYAKGLGLIAARIPSGDMNSDGAKAVAKVLLMGQEMAQGRLSAEQVKQYTDLMQGMHDLLDQGKARTSQEALKMALAQLGYDADGKIAELLKCKLAI